MLKIVPNPTPASANQLLSALPADDLAALERELEPCALELRQTLHLPHQPLTHAYFIESGLGSILIGPERTTGVEVGIVGREGMVGLPIVLGAGQSPHHCFIQSPGRGWRITAGALAELMESRPAVRWVLLRYAHYFMQQLSATAYANADFTVEERLARWLLLCLDRQDTPELTVTHEFLALMLGVRRPGVTVATHVLEGEGMIKATRGLITVLDRSKLERVAGESYGVAEAEYARILGRASATLRPA